MKLHGARKRCVWRQRLAAVILLLGGAMPAAAQDDGASLFAPGWQWTDEHGRTVAFADWRGQPLVVTMIYTSCPTRCPMTVSHLKKMDEALRRDGTAAQFFLVTLDPAKDTPERLLNYKERRNLPGETWHLLRGDQRQTQAMAAFIDLHPIYDDIQIEHEAKVAVVDAQGHIVKSLRGWRYSAQELGEAVDAAPPAAGGASGDANRQANHGVIKF